MKIIELNGENNGKMLPKNKKDSWEWTYASTGRHLVRMHWLTKFVTTLFFSLAISLHVNNSARSILIFSPSENDA